jgi:hypothetical protein
LASKQIGFVFRAFASFFTHQLDILMVGITRTLFLQKGRFWHFVYAKDNAMA